MIHLTDAEFAYIETRMLLEYGLNLSKKRGLIEARLARRLTETGAPSFSHYFELLRRRPEERECLVSRLTTNHTGFLREPAHFSFLEELIRSGFANRAPAVWSAGCSSGEEPYSIVMTLCDCFRPARPPLGTGVLATDISPRVLEAARKGSYSDASLAVLPPAWLRRYFMPEADGRRAVSPEIRRLVRFESFNLMQPFPFRRRFDLIFCRNVMIYFTPPGRNALAERLFDALRPGGYLLIGHSEMLPREKSRLKFVSPSIYRRPTD